MYEKQLEQIDRAIEASRAELTQDIIKLIGIKSIKGAPEPGAPFGRGPRKMLDAVLKMGREEGFHPIEHTDAVISLALKEGQPDLGIWLHGDVVPEGTGWNFDPYHATEYKGCIIGRGATDNKGQLCAIFHLLKIFKDLGISLKYNPALYVGSDEENGMRDITGIPGDEAVKGFCNVCTSPRLSLVPDAGFPIGYGGKGSMTVTFRSKKPLNDLYIVAGQDSSPGKAVATSFGKSYITHSQPRHSSNPDPNGNMITMLMEQLLNRKETAEADRPVLSFFKMLSLDIYGEQLGINVKTETMRPLTVFAQKINTVNGYPTLTVNIRYPIEITHEEIVERLMLEAGKYGVEVIDAHSIIKPYLNNEKWDIITRLTDIAKEITGNERDSYTLNGGTYAHVLPNALVYGINGCLRPEGFPSDRGSEHGNDELVSLDRLEEGMKVYARALLALNDMEW